MKNIVYTNNAAILIKRNGDCVGIRCKDCPCCNGLCKYGDGVSIQEIKAYAEEYIENDEE